MHDNLHKLEIYKGKNIADVIDEIRDFAKKHGFTVNIGFPDGIGNIDQDLTRLNVYVDKNDRFTRYTVG